MNLSLRCVLSLSESELLCNTSLSVPSLAVYNLVWRFESVSISNVNLSFPTIRNIFDRLLARVELCSWARAALTESRVRGLAAGPPAPRHWHRAPEGQLSA